MKKLYTLALVSLLGISLMSFTTGSVATLNSEFEINITEITTDGQYELDHSLVFKNNKQKAAYFTGLQNNLLMFTVDMSSGDVTMKIFPEYLQTPWSIAEWNEFLEQHSKVFSETYGRLTALVTD